MFLFDKWKFLKLKVFDTINTINNRVFSSYFSQNHNFHNNDYLYNKFQWYFLVIKYKWDNKFLQ